MNSTELVTDGAVVVRSIAAPSRGLAEAALRGRSGIALAVSTAAALAFAFAAAPRADFSAAALARLDAASAAPNAVEPTPHEREEALATAAKLGRTAAFAGAALGPALAAAAAAAALWLAFRVAGTRPSFRGSLAVAAHGLLPVWIARALSIPAALSRSPLPARELGSLLPSSLAAFLPPGAPAPLQGALGAVDLFALWALALVALGMARASGASRRRALAVTAFLFVAQAAVAGVAVPSLLAAAAGGGGS